MKPLPAEFLGTFFFCLVALMAGTGLAAALALIAAMTALGYLSGGHFNPAISMAVWLRGQMEATTALRYAASQTAGALLAVGLHHLLADPAGPRAAAIRPILLRITAGEVLFTMAVAFVFLHVRTARQQPHSSMTAAAVGATHFAGSAALASLGAGACNPTLGLAWVLAGQVPPVFLFAYLLAAGLGGGGAIILYRLLNPDD